MAAGPRLASVADVPADRTGSGEAVVRATLLAVVTSPGGIATSLAAAHAGDAGVAVSNAAGAIVNIGFESLPILVVYAGSFVLLALPLAPFGLFSRLPLDALP